jgi:hypothetical protein
MILNPQASWKKKTKEDQEESYKKSSCVSFHQFCFLGKQERTKESFNQVESFKT